jgi:hypothetical protein
MTTTNYLCRRLSSACLITGAGILRGLIISHDQTTAQSVTFYDNTAASGTILLKVWVAPEQCPVHLEWQRAESPSFSTGLSYAVSHANVEVSVWASEYD